MATREQIVATARDWIGTPWRHQGRTRLGVDCVGLVVMVARDLGLSDYDWNAYSRRAHGGSFLPHFEANARNVGLARARPGDMLVFADASYPCHVGVLSHFRGEPHVIHALATLKKVWETPYAGEWERKARFAFAFPGVED